MDTRPPFNLHCNDMQGYAPVAVGHGGSESRKQDGPFSIAARSVVAYLQKNLNTRIWEFVNGSRPWDGDAFSHWQSSAPSGLESPVGTDHSSAFNAGVSLPAGTKNEGRLGRRKPGAGPDPKCSTENHSRSLLSPRARSPSPSNKHLATHGYPWPVATPKSREV